MSICRRENLEVKVVERYCSIVVSASKHISRLSRLSVHMCFEISNILLQSPWWLDVFLS